MRVKPLPILIACVLSALFSCDYWGSTFWGFKNDSSEQITVAVYRCEYDSCAADPIKQFLLSPGEARGFEFEGDIEMDDICFGAYTVTDPHFAGCGKGCAYRETMYDNDSCHSMDDGPVPTTIITKGNPAVSGGPAPGEAAE